MKFKEEEYPTDRYIRQHILHTMSVHAPYQVRSYGPEETRIRYGESQDKTRTMKPAIRSNNRQLEATNSNMKNESNLCCIFAKG